MGQQIFDFRVDLLDVIATLKFGPDATMRIDEECDRQAINSTEGLAGVGGADDERIIDFELCCDSLSLWHFIVHVDADDLESATVLGLPLREGRHFCLAGCAPGGPEVEENNFSAILSQTDGFVMEILQGEGRRRMADQLFWLLGLRKVRCRESEEEQRADADGSQFGEWECATGPVVQRTIHFMLL